MSLYLFRREARGTVPECWDEIEAIYRQVEHLFDHLQTIYRPMALDDGPRPPGPVDPAPCPEMAVLVANRGAGPSGSSPRSCEVAGDFDPDTTGRRPRCDGGLEGRSRRRRGV